MYKCVRQRNADETVNIITAGQYDCEGTHIIPMPLTTIYLQSDIIRKLGIQGEYVSMDNRFVRKNTQSGKNDTLIETWQSTSLAAAEKLRTQYPDDKIAILNFASAKNPGGGFLNGAQAQEESLARSSSLYGSLSNASLFYHVNEIAKSKVYTHSIIYSGGVTVIRDTTENEGLLEIPYVVDIITCPAVNRRITHREENNYIDSVIIERAKRVLCVAYKHRVKHLILGAWGCGVFQNDPWTIVNMFLDLLREEFEGTFNSIIFAVPDEKTYECFSEATK